MKATEVVGLGGQSYTAKSYRPTGTPVAAQGKLNPDSVRAVGRWKNRECFEEHYVYSKPDTSITDIILLPWSVITTWLVTLALFAIPEMLKAIVSFPFRRLIPG